MSQDSSLERRVGVRVPVALTIEIREGQNFSLHATRDVSEGGLFFDRAIPHPEGARVDLCFTLPGESAAMNCQGEVVNVPDAQSFGMGIRFIGLTDADASRLRSFLNDALTTLGVP